MLLRKSTCLALKRVLWSFPNKKKKKHSKKYRLANFTLFKSFIDEASWKKISIFFCIPLFTIKKLPKNCHYNLSYAYDVIILFIIKNSYYIEFFLWKSNHIAFFVYRVCLSNSWWRIWVENWISWRSSKWPKHDFLNIFSTPFAMTQVFFNFIH